MSNDPVRDIGDIVSEHVESEGNAAFDKQRTPNVDVARLRQWLESVSDYSEIVVQDALLIPARELIIVEAHRGPKTANHPFGTFILSVR